MSTENHWPPKLNRRDERLRGAHGLTAKRDGWYKSIGGKTRYICKRLTLADAVALIDVRRSEINAGRTRATRAVAAATITLKNLVNLFLADCWQRVVTGQPVPMSRDTYEDYEETLADFCAVVGNDRIVNLMGPDDFTTYVNSIRHLAGTSIRRKMIYVDRLFNWAGPGKNGAGLIPDIRRGPTWVKPEGVGKTDKAYTIEQLRDSHTRASTKPMLHAAWHLGFGSGFIPSDIATLRDEQVKMDDGVIVFPEGREKTGISRLCPLHPAAIAALRAYLAVRKPPVNDAATMLFFRTQRGTPLSKWYEGTRNDHHVNELKRPWRRRVGLPFSGLRTTLANLLDDWPDQRAVDVILGHKSTERAKHIRTVHYARQFNPDRSRRAVEHAYQIVFGPPDPAPGSAPVPAAAVAADQPVPPATPAAILAMRARRRGRSGTSASPRPAHVRPSRATRR